MESAQFLAAMLPTNSAARNMLMTAMQIAVVISLEVSTRAAPMDVQVDGRPVGKPSPMPAISPCRARQSRRSLRMLLLM
jgi:hypothetical protein